MGLEEIIFCHLLFFHLSACKEGKLKKKSSLPREFAQSHSKLLWNINELFLSLIFSIILSGRKEGQIFIQPSNIYWVPGILQRPSYLLHYKIEWDKILLFPLYGWEIGKIVVLWERRQKTWDSGVWLGKATSSFPSGSWKRTEPSPEGEGGINNPVHSETPGTCRALVGLSVGKLGSAAISHPGGCSHYSLRLRKGIVSDVVGKRRNRSKMPHRLLSRWRQRHSQRRLQLCSSSTKTRTRAHSPTHGPWSSHCPSFK